MDQVERSNLSSDKCYCYRTIYLMFNAKGENREGQLDACFVRNIMSYILLDVLFANAYFYLYTFIMSHSK